MNSATSWNYRRKFNWDSTQWWWQYHILLDFIWLANKLILIWHFLWTEKKTSSTYNKKHVKTSFSLIFLHFLSDTMRTTVVYCFKVGRLLQFYIFLLTFWLFNKKSFLLIACAQYSSSLTRTYHITRQLTYITFADETKIIQKYYMMRASDCDGRKTAFT